MGKQIDTLQYAQRLENAGVPKEQAAVHANALADVLAKLACRSELAEVEANLRAELHQTEERLTNRIDRAWTDLNAKIDLLEISLRGDLKTLHSMGVTIVALNAAILVELLT